LTKEFVEGDEKRPGSSAFKSDPMLPINRRAQLDDYKGFKDIFDRGHQVASGDSKGRGKPVIKESFYLSNMTPQSAKLNRNRWRLLEAKIQDIAKNRGEIWVVTGPVFIDDDNDGLVEHVVIGDNNVSVPTDYYKIVISKKPENTNEWEAMAFLIPNEPISEPYEDYLVSIDEIESLTKIDFFSSLSDDAEVALEEEIAEQLWEDS
jgi:endonuclease G